MSQQINLYSPLFRKKKKLFTATAMVQALGFVLGVLLLYYGYARFQVSALERQATQSERRLKSTMEQFKALPGTPLDARDDKALSARIAELESGLKSNEELLAQTAGSEQREYIEPLRALARQRLEGVWLSSISLTGDSGELSLNGHALHADLIPLYVERLAQDRAMRGRQFSTFSIEREPAAGAIGFKLLAPAPEGG